MKRFFVLIITFIFILSGCTLSDTAENSSEVIRESIPMNPNSNDLRGVWISYYEMNLSGLGETEYREKVTDMFKAAADFGLNAVFVHMRANSDAFYPSKLFPWAAQMTADDGTTPDYDTLAIMCEIAHSMNLQLHAWINPYRVSALISDPAGLSDGCPAKVWLSDSDESNDDWAIVCDGGIYYNPAIPEVQQLITDGAAEIAENYPVDGIHFDDYFYPTNDAEFDKEAYNEYRSLSENPLSLSDWRRENVNTLIRKVYEHVHSAGKVFGISPAADISDDCSDRNYNELYADIGLWIKSEGYVDYIAPQLYFGFEYPLEEFRFGALLGKWTSLERLDTVKMYIGLAGYKTGKEDAGSDEWIKQGDILAKQNELIKGSEAEGFIVFSYSNLISDEPLLKAQMENLKSTLVTTAE